MTFNTIWNSMATSPAANGRIWEGRMPHRPSVMPAQHHPTVPPPLQRLPDLRGRPPFAQDEQHDAGDDHDRAEQDEQGRERRVARHKAAQFRHAVHDGPHDLGCGGDFHASHGFHPFLPTS
ncbi:hypothetical protein [Bifidobacterium longum]|uniref:hypothetical protein n=1 Tax=Bifidobacterium longum TaxID=216816 RepID=UPI0012BCC806|nr:hypothetical protein [Bifidobacterium longum]